MRHLSQSCSSQEHEGSGGSLFSNREGRISNMMGSQKAAEIPSWCSKI